MLEGFSAVRHDGVPRRVFFIAPLALAGLAIMLTSCATPQPPQAFHNTDNTALVGAGTTRGLFPDETVLNGAGNSATVI